MKLYVIFLNEYGEKIGTKASLYNRINRLKTGKPKKRNDSTECIEWANTIFYQEQVLTDDDSDMEIEVDIKGPGHPKSRLANKPVRKTVRRIMKPKIDNLIEFAEEQGVSYEEVVDLMAERCSKKK